MAAATRDNYHTADPHLAVAQDLAVIPEPRQEVVGSIGAIPVHAEDRRPKGIRIGLPAAGIEVAVNDPAGELQDISCQEPKLRRLKIVEGSRRYG